MIFTPVMTGWNRGGMIPEGMNGLGSVGGIGGVSSTDDKIVRSAAGHVVFTLSRLLGLHLAFPLCLSQPFQQVRCPLCWSQLSDL